jgi:hypothetical protein
MMLPQQDSARGHVFWFSLSFLRCCYPNSIHLQPKKINPAYAMLIAKPKMLKAVRLFLQRL